MAAPIGYLCTILVKLERLPRRRPNNIMPLPKHESKSSGMRHRREDLTVSYAAHDEERPRRVKSYSQRSALIFTLLLLISYISNASIGKTLFVSSGIQTYDAVIVGAGWAGIKAAETLLKGGVDNILVLEAHDYIGGRSKSVNLDGSINNPLMHGNFTNIPIDMGSEWLYKGTTLSRTLINGGYLKGIDANKKDAQFVPFFDSPFYLQTFVQEKDENNAAATLKTERMEDEKVKDLHDRVWGGFSEFTQSLKQKGGGDESYWSAAKKYKEEKLTSDLDAQFIDLAMAATEVDFTGGSNELSVFGETIDDDMEPVHYMSVPGVGYGNTAAKFSSASSSHKVHLNSKVTEIDYSNPNGAVVSFAKNGEESKVMAKTVLVTVSLGVLKAGNIKFTPSLPDWKQEVIDGMGFGLLNKCVMQWNDPDAAVWPNEDWIELITPKGENSGKWTTFFNPTSYKGVPILVGWAAAENARYMETQTDEEVLADVMTKLKAMFPTITNPDRIIITRWGSEENVRGTYSFEKVGRESFSDDSEQLRMPVENVWFAGEATSGSWYGTVNGACKSGERAANGMLEVLSAISDV